MTKIISVIQNKGGVGKTTTTQNLGYLFSKLGKTLLIDLDSQANLSQLFDIYLEKTDLSNFIDFGHGIHELNDMLSIVPNSLSFEFWKQNSNNKRNSSYKLKVALDKIKDNYDYILIDSPPSLDISIDLALYSSDYYLIVMDGHKLSLNGLENIFTEIDKIKSEDITSTFHAKNLGIVFNRYKKTVITDQIIENVRINYDVFNTVIRDSIQVVESQAENKTIIEYSINNNVSKDFQELFKEVFKKING